MREAQKIARENTPKAMQTLVDLMDDIDPRVRAVAAQAVLDRALGKAKEQLPERAPAQQLDLSGLTDVELVTFEKILKSIGVDKIVRPVPHEQHGEGGAGK